MAIAKEFSRVKEAGVMSLVSFVFKQRWPRHNLRALCRALLRRLQRRLNDLINPYRPEFHYMRGPGPKWREKHGNLSTRAFDLREASGK
jgi:hypothetical protein